MKTKNESIIRKEKIEQTKFKNFVFENKEIKKFDFTDTDCPYDVKMRSGSTLFMAEIKVRQDKDTAYFDKYGPFLELKKIEGMWREKERIKREKGVDMQMLYFNFSSNGLQIYYLNEPWKYNFSWRLLPKDNYEPHIKVWKMVAELKNPQEVINKLF